MTKGGDHRLRRGGRHLRPGPAAAGAGVAAFDVAPAARARAEAAGIAAADAPAACRGADIVFVCVTAGSVLDAMRSLAGALGHAPFVVDVNSVSPATKQEAAAIVERPAAATWRRR